MANAHIDRLRTPPLIEPFDLHLADGEALALLGPPGAGKTRLLRAIAGLDPVEEGHVRIDQAPVEGRKPTERSVAMVFSRFTLYPHLDVEGNIDFPMLNAGLNSVERRERIDDLATQLDLVSVLDRMPTEVTAGQRLRTAIARALARTPSLLLIDDGLSGLSSTERQHARKLLRTIQRTMRLTTIYATGDFADAMPLADRIAFLHGGRLHQTDTPAHIYDNPATTAVATGLGSPRINLIDGVYRNGSLHLAGQAVELRLSVDGESFDDRKVLVGIRPETFDVAGNRNNSILAILDPTSRQSLGSYSIVNGQVGTEDVFAQVAGNPTDFPRRAYAAPEQLLLFDADTGNRLR